MKKIKVKKGHHYPNLFKRWICPKIYWKTFKIEKEFIFTEESLFIFDGEDRFDYSKLFGLSFGHHQKNESYRFGFRFTDKFFVEVSEYKYINGKREVDDITSLLLNMKYKFILSFDKKNKIVRYIIKDKDDIIYYNDIKITNFKLFGYTLGLYIGGNNPAPKNLKFYYE